MRLVFFGASDLSYRCCELIVGARLAELVGIVTCPRQFAISYSTTKVTNVRHADMKEFGARHGVPVIEVEGKLGGIREQLLALRPDLILVIGWYYMVPKVIRDLAPKGCLGIHASLLPKYRGGAPLVWAMINGETDTGVTLFHLADGVDDGEVVGQERIGIAATDTIAEVLHKAEVAGLSLLRQFLPAIATGNAPRRVQNHAEATMVPQRSPKDGEIDWNWDAVRIQNFIRAQTHPYPGAFTVINGKKVTLWSASVEDPP